MIKYLENLDLDIYICLDQKKEPEGLEKKMIDYLNKNSDDIFAKIKLNYHQKENMIENIPYRRMRDIKKIPKIGNGTYEKLFVYLKNNVENSNHQISFFEKE